MIVRRPVQLVAGGISEAAADLGGMDPSEALELRNAFFDTISTISVRRGSANGDNMQDDQGSPADVTSVPYIKFFPSQGQIFTIGHSTVTDKHYVYKLSTAAEEPTTPGNPVSPIIIPAAGAFTYDVADPVVFTGAPWYNRQFYAADAAGEIGMIVLNGDTDTVTFPVFTLGTGPAQPLRPRKLFTHQNHMIALSYGDENTPYVADMLRSSQLGNPNVWPAEAFNNIGNSDEPLLNGISVGDFAILFKEFKIFRMAGSADVNWSFTEIDPDRGGVNGRCATYYEDFVWFLSAEGFARIGINGPSQLIVDKAKLTFASFTNLENCWVDANLPERMIVFACHETGDAGTFPTLLVQYDTRNGRITVRDYLVSGPLPFESFFGARIPQVDAVASQLGPQGPPTISPVTAETTDGFTANWVNGDIRPLTTTRVEVKNVDQSGEWIQKASAPFGDTSIAITGLDPGTLYDVRVRHERNSIFSDYSGTVQAFIVAVPPSVQITAQGPGGITLEATNPNSDGFGQLFFEQSTDPIMFCPQASPGYDFLGSISNPGPVENLYVGGIICDISYQFRTWWGRTGWSDTAYSNLPCIPYACLSGT